MRPSLAIATLLMAPLSLAACAQQPPASTQPWKRHLIDHAGAGADGVRAADANGDDRSDLVVGWEQSGQTTLYLSTNSPNDEPRWVMSLLVEDMNADGYPDLLLSDRRGKLAGVRWLEHPGVEAPDLRKPWKNHFVGAAGREVMFISAADLDGDGLKEIVVPHFLADDWKLRLFKRETDERWVEHAIVYPASAGRPKSVAVGDIDLDGRPDLVLATGQAYGERRGIVWLRNAGSPFDADWETVDVSGPDGIKFDLSLLVDVDRDGDLDVLNTEEHDNAAGGNPGLGVVWYENPTLR